MEKRQATIGEWGCPPRFVTDFELPEASLTDPAAGMTIHIDLGKEKPDITHPYILTWSASDDAPFFCLEPYTGLTDAINNRCGLHILQSMECLSTSLSYSVSFGK